MTAEQFKIFDTFRKELRAYCQDFNVRFGSELAPLQKAAADKWNIPAYPIETPVVYNTALDLLDQNSVITKIVIGDNPGKNEQLAKNQKYLVGLAGKVAQGFFERNPEFGTDFRKNAIILNKTPVHSAKTNHLKYIVKNGSSGLKAAINDSAVWMAQKTAKLHMDLCAAAGANPVVAPELWLVGYAELKEKGLFTNYRDELKKTYQAAAREQNTAPGDGITAPGANLPSSGENPWDKVFVFQHFSMSRFTIDLDAFKEKNGLQSNLEACLKLGKIHRDEIFGPLA